MSRLMKGRDMTDTMLTLTHATERDVDLLLVEELKCSAVFADWFVGCIFPSARPDFQGAEVVPSKRRLHNRREIDITVLLTATDYSVALLIENKLDTSEQPGQAESYREEARALVASGVASEAVTILVCPQSYLGSNATFAEKFDSNITYEQIAGFLRERAEAVEGELRARIRHHCELIEQAITKARRGYEAVPVAEVDSFNTRYIDLLARHALDLSPGPSMLAAGRPGASNSKSIPQHSGTRGAS